MVTDAADVSEKITPVYNAAIIRRRKYIHYVITVQFQSFCRAETEVRNKECFTRTNLKSIQVLENTSSSNIYVGSTDQGALCLGAL